MKSAFFAALAASCTAGAAEFSFDYNAGLLKAEGGEVSAVEAKKDPSFAFTVDVKAHEKCRVSVKNLPPKNYFITVDGWGIGDRRTVEDIAAGIEVELAAGRSRVEFSKRYTGKADFKTRQFWQSILKRIPSTYDGSLQPCYFKAPEKAKSEAVPLIVGLHTWSCDYFQLDHYATVLKTAEQRGWAFVGPNFRGPNQTPPACGGEAAVQDIVDAVNYAKAQVKIDPKRVYIIGGSGGGHMTLLMCGRHPEIFAAGSAFCPITDVARWHADSLLDHPGRGKGYAKMLEGACGGTPAARPAEYTLRSPLTWLSRARDAGVPIYVCTGIHDGWIGSVPVGHSFRAFNALCRKGDEVSEKDIAEIEETQKIPAGLDAGDKADTFYTNNGKSSIHFRRTSGNVRLTIFEGGHGGNFQAGFDFLARQEKGKPADWTLPATGRGCEEHLSK